ncbi:MMPL family transporter [Streptomyces sp. NBC_00102]|uniref:MMPL family transporter n=1 Tax=Streptomyces sp. NBC_00102 TaxID=2975652 RepID=UPI00225A2275|nr:MMPL family transporter [Streptomyces sp. NBC_00102]MCX5401384.1 MMPL family transporter [Streptomyces sp. NBC_00102]
MASFLYRLGLGAFHRRLLVIALWGLVLVGAAVGSAVAPEAKDSATTMPGIESQQAYDLMAKRFPGAASDGATARIVFVAPDGERVTSAENRAVVDETVTEAAGAGAVASAVGPFAAGAVSEDGSTAYATVTFKETANDLTDAEKAPVQDAIDDARASGMTVEVGGDALAGQVESGGPAEGIGILVAAVVLLVTFGSLVAAGLPLLTAVVGVGVSVLAIGALASTFGLSSSTSSLASMLGLAVGIDYALFVVSRYREERGKGRGAREATGMAVGTAGSAVVFAGLTVIIALAGLFVVGIPTLTTMGFAAAGAVAVGILIALTLVPALLGLWPNTVLPRRLRKVARRARKAALRTAAPGEGRRARRRAAARAADGAVAAASAEGVHAKPAENGGSRWARFVTRRPLPVLIASVIGLGVVALPVLDLQLGMPGAESKSVATTERRAYDALAEGFGPGFNGPLTIVVDAQGASDPQDAVADIHDRLAGTRGVESVSAPRFNAAGDTAVLSAVPSTSPTDKATVELVDSIRGDRGAIEDGTGATFEVTGTTALNIDVAQKIQDALVPYLILIVGLALLLLMMVFRSVLVPLKATLGFLLSVLAALGAVVAVFQWGWAADLLGVEQAGPIMSMMPIFLVGIVFGLAMDYEVFLVSRIRESYVHGESPKEAVVSGFRASGRVVVAAALIMMSVFAGFVTAGESMVKTIGFGLAIAVLFDALVVRMAFVPAVLALLGRWAWWLPKPLARILPKVDVEGEKLAGEAAPAEAAEADSGRSPEREPAGV